MSGSPGDETVMVGGGYYNAHSEQQRDAIALSLPLLERAAAAAPLPGLGQPFVVADYGAAAGRNSLLPMQTVIAAVRQRLPSPAPISIVHTDLPENDFNALFVLLGESPESYLRDAPEVYAFATGKTMYEQVLPADQVAVGYTASTVHWMSAAPCAIPGQIWPARATGAVRAAFVARGRQDWETFLARRARELRPGGQLVVLAGVADAAGASGAESLLDLANEVLQELVAAGTLAAAEYARMVLPMYYRTAEQYTAPLAAGAASPVGRALRLVEQQEASLADVYWAQYERTGDASGYAADYTAYLRAFTEPVLFGPATVPRAASERARLARTYYARVEERIAAAPARAICHWRVILLRIARHPAA